MRLRSQFVIVSLLALLVFAGGVGTGYAIQREGHNPNVAGLVTSWVPWRAQSQTDLHLSVLQEALAILEQDFINELPSSEILNRAAIRGILTVLDDPYTVLLEPDIASMNQADMEGEFGGIGAHVEWDEDLKAVRIVEPFADSPAQAAGLRRGDYLITVDGIPIADLGLTGAVFRIRGPVDTSVVLEIRRGEEQWEVTVTRQLLEIQVVEHTLLGSQDTVGYVKLSTFNAKSAEAVRNSVQELLDADIEALILDLRDNSGGLLDQSVAIAGLFVGRQVVTEQYNQDGSTIVHRAQRRSLVPADIEVVVLVNESSASASEVVAGALQDHGRGYLIGEATFGKGSVQRTNILSDDSQLRVTVSRWYTPLGRSLEEEGLEPDLMVEMTMDDYGADLDPQLDAALAYLQRISNRDGQS